MAILSFGVLSLASFYTQGLKSSNQVQMQYTCQSEGATSPESIFTARDTQVLSFSEINHVSAGRVFLDGPQPLLGSGPDGVVGNGDDDAKNPDEIVIVRSRQYSWNQRRCPNPF